MQHTIANATYLHQFCTEPMIYLCCIIPLKPFSSAHTVPYKFLDMFPMTKALSGVKSALDMLEAI